MAHAENVHTRFCLLKLFIASQVLEQFIDLSALYLDGFSGSGGGRPSAGASAWTAIVGARSGYENACVTPC